MSLEELELELGLVLEPVVEPAPAEPFVEDEELEGLEDDAPPPAWLLFVASLELDEELDGDEEVDGEVALGELDIEPEDEAEPDGEVLGEAVVPLADEDELGEVALGDVVEPDGEVVDDELDAPDGERFSPRSQPASTAAPNARETARANVDTFMWPPWLGYVNQ